MPYAWGKASVVVRHYTVAMWSEPDFVQITDKRRPQPGDVVMFEGPPPGHTGVYIGEGEPSTPPTPARS